MNLDPVNAHSSKYEVGVDINARPSKWLLESIGMGESDTSESPVEVNPCPMGTPISIRSAPSVPVAIHSSTVNTTTPRLKGFSQKLLPYNRYNDHHG